MKSSTYLRSWALEQWPENTQVNLAEELTPLKALIRAQCERAIAAGIDPDAIDIIEEDGLRGSVIASSPSTDSQSRRICLLTRGLPLISPRQ